MNNPIEKIKMNIGNMTEAQRHISDFIIKNSFDAAFMTIDQMADAVGISTTTIMRLMAAIGYSGYSEFQKNLQGQLRDRYSPTTRLRANLKDINESDLWNKCYLKQMDNITETFSIVSTDTLDQVVHSIVRAGTVYFSAVRGGIMVAQYLHSFFSRMFGNCRLVQGEVASEWSTMIPTMNEKDVVFSISYPRYGRYLVDFVRIAHEQHVKTIVLTDGYSSPLAEHADLILPCACGTLGFHNSPLSAMMLADCIINVASLRYSQEIKNRLDKSSGILENLGFYCT